MAKDQKKPIKTYWHLIIKLPDKSEQDILFIFIDGSGQDLFKHWDTHKAIDILENVDREFCDAAKPERCMIWRHDNPNFSQGVYRCSIHASLNDNNSPYLVLREQEQTAFFPNGNINKPGQILGRIVPMIMNRCS